MKHIIVACDGTGNSASRGKEYSPSTNVNRICHAIRPCATGPKPIRQMIFYQSGIGTQDLGLTGAGKLIQGVVGDGIEENVADAYTFIMNNYEAGDKIFFFGFSRGAYTARVLANFICQVGIYHKPAYTWSFKAAYKDYIEGNFVNKPECIAGHKFERPNDPNPVPKTHEVEIEVVGCWDTVSSLGGPLDQATNIGGISGAYQWLDGSLLPGIKHAFHALALDECRRPFTPTLWFLPKDAKAVKSIDLQQCWFPGAHSNAGGGYFDTALSDLTLAWMIDRCRPFLEFDQDYINTTVRIGHNPGERRSSSRQSRADNEKRGYDLTYQGWGRGRWYDSYKLGQTWTWRYRTPKGYEGGETNETIHASVRERWLMSRQPGKGLTDGFGPSKNGPAAYVPESLNGFEPRERADGKWEWVKKEKGKEVLVIQEAPFPERNDLPSDLRSIGTSVSFEGLLRYASKWEPEKTSK
ncbi:hypothetical protein PM082_020615 [Marasmius tenuissimus]|nr:hypothetical protein PM082_020615 [Marasmius tenuissimus]